MNFGSLVDQQFIKKLKIYKENTDSLIHSLNSHMLTHRYTLSLKVQDIYYFIWHTFFSCFSLAQRKKTKIIVIEWATNSEKDSIHYANKIYQTNPNFIDLQSWLLTNTTDLKCEHPNSLSLSLFFDYFTQRWANAIEYRW